MHEKHALKLCVSRKALLRGRRKSTKKGFFISKAVLDKRRGISFLKERTLLNAAWREPPGREKEPSQIYWHDNGWRSLIFVTCVPYNLEAQLRTKQKFWGFRNKSVLLCSFLNGRPYSSYAYFSVFTSGIETSDLSWQIYKIAEGVDPSGLWQTKMITDRSRLRDVTAVGIHTGREEAQWLWNTRYSMQYYMAWSWVPWYKHMLCFSGKLSIIIPHRYPCIKFILICLSFNWSSCFHV